MLRIVGSYRAEKPHPLKPEGAAPKGRLGERFFYVELIVGVVASKSRDLGNDRGYRSWRVVWTLHV